jgi:hypothetical protein
MAIPEAGEKPRPDSRPNLDYVGIIHDLAGLPSLRNKRRAVLSEGPGYDNIVNNMVSEGYNPLCVDQVMRLKLRPFMGPKMLLDNLGPAYKEMVLAFINGLKSYPVTSQTGIIEHGNLVTILPLGSIELLSIGFTTHKFGGAVILPDNIYADIQTLENKIDVSLEQAKRDGLDMGLSRTMAQNHCIWRAATNYDDNLLSLFSEIAADRTKPSEKMMPVHITGKAPKRPELRAFAIGPMREEKFSLDSRVPVYDDTTGHTAHVIGVLPSAYMSLPEQVSPPEKVFMESMWAALDAQQRSR